jgi:anti-sigma regulatory factor (Ser/Thr protein kinase)
VTSSPITRRPRDDDFPALAYHLPADARSPKAARSILGVALEGFPSDTTELAQLLVSELVTNAVLHAESGVVLRVRIAGKRIEIAVEDSSHSHPNPKTPSGDMPGGRGLQLIDSLATSWGWDPLSGGKRVWFEL